MSGAAPFLQIPSEIAFAILTFLSVPDLLIFRQTCKKCLALSQDRGLWIDHLRLQRASLPLPAYARDDISLLTLPSERVEHIAISSYKSQHNWLNTRPAALPLGDISVDRQARDILYLGFLLDKLVLCVYSQGTIVIWDVGSGSTKSKMPLSFWELWGPEPWTSALACADVDEGAIYVAITRAQNRSQQGSTTVLMRVPLPEDDINPSADSESCPSTRDTQFNDIDTLFGGDAQVVRTLDPSRHLVAFSRSPFIDIVHWPSNTGISIDTQRDEVDQLWNGIIGLQFVDSHLLCIKARSLELYPITVPFPASSSYFVSSNLGPVHPTASTTPSTRANATALRPAAFHSFPTTTFRGVSFSHPSTTSSPLSNTTSLSILAHDVLRGVFHYRIDLITPSSPSPSPALPPFLRINLVGIHDMAHGVPAFVSTAALGPQSRRGVWIERTKNTTARRVVVFSTSAGGGADDSAKNEAEEPPAREYVDDEVNGVFRAVGTPPIDARTVYELSSYDLRDDLLHVAFSEVTGRIALGTRSGEIRVI